MDFVRMGVIMPLPTKVFDAPSAYEAFRYMQGGQHIGRICVSIRDAAGSSKIPKEALIPQKKLFLDPNASYLLIGGLGGLGRSVSTWMVEHGACHLVFFSRSCGLKPSDQAFVRELESTGCKVQLIRGSITSTEDVALAVKASTRPLKGVLQMSMVLQDEGFFNMTFEQWQNVVSPKVQGTWNIHHATTHCQLDLFVLFSSVSGIVGQPGQANYATGNAFLDAFVKFRQGHGLAASSINIGPMADVGYLVDHQDLLQKASITGFKALIEQDLLDALLVAMSSRSSSNIAEQINSKTSQYTDHNTFVLGLGSTIPLDHPSSRAVWRNDPRFAIYRNATSSATSALMSDNSLKAYLMRAKADKSVLSTPEAAVFLAEEIGKQLFTLLMKSAEKVNISSTMVELGLDSLIGIELRAWWKQVFGFDISVLEMLSIGNLEALGKFAAKGLLQKYST
jgi:NAD(P)-dependent dehydrogenase (short-subunit alcohol dehydrogenase family)/aryl carrier-like protein